MKKTILILAIFAFNIPFTFARQGEHDGDPNHNDGRSIVCNEQMTGTLVLQFTSSQTQGQVNLTDYDLTVKTRGDDIAEVTIFDKRTGDSLKTKRLEELLKTTLIADEISNPVIIEAKTHRGYAETKIISSTSGDNGFIKSLSRHGQSSIEIRLQTDENPNSPIETLCQKVR